jgi:hypothetical protein
MENRKRTFEELLKERDALADTLSGYKDILRGTMVKRGNICGKTGCRCKRKDNPIPHGPYNYLSHRSKEKTQMIFLNKIKRQHAIKGIRQYRELIETIYKISEINFNILRYHYNKIDGKG